MHRTSAVLALTLLNLAGGSAAAATTFSITLNYTGANSLAAYRTEFNQPGAAFVPVEMGGGGGTADGHWNEVDVGADLTGLVSNVSGQDMAYELMTGWLNLDQPYFISNLTRGSLQDLGYNVVPEPSAAAFGFVVLAGLGLARRRLVK